MKIAIFTPFFSAGVELESGIGVHYRDLAIGLKQSGEDVVVFHFPYDTTESKSWDFEGIKVHSVGIKTPAITKIRGIGSLCNLVKFFDFFEAFQLLQNLGQFSQSTTTRNLSTSLRHPAIEESHSGFPRSKEDHPSLQGSPQR